MGGFDTSETYSSSIGRMKLIKSSAAGTTEYVVSDSTNEVGTPRNKSSMKTADKGLRYFSFKEGSFLMEENASS